MIGSLSIRCNRNKVAGGTILIFVVSLMFFAGPTWADDNKEIEKLFVDRYLTCADVALNCSQLIPKYYDNGKFDSVHILLDYWENTCGRLEVIDRIRLLMAVFEGQLHQMPFDGYNIYHMISWIRQLRLGPKYWQGEVSPIHSDFDSLTIRMARELEGNPTNTPIDNWICRLYKGDTVRIFEELGTPAYDGTTLQQEYRSYVQWVIDYRETYYGLFTGVWVPTGPRKLLGSHPTIGIFFSGRIKRSIFDFGLSGSFIDSPDKYMVVKGSDVDTTDTFLLLIGDINYGYEFYRNRRHSLFFSVGVGFQNLTAVASENTEERREVASMLGAVGMGYRFYLGSYASSYLELRPRVEFSKINTNGGTDLSGAAFTVRLSWGWDASSNSWKDSRLKDLQYRF